METPKLKAGTNGMIVLEYNGNTYATFSTLSFKPTNTGWLIVQNDTLYKAVTLIDDNLEVVDSVIYTEPLDVVDATCSDKELLLSFMELLTSGKATAELSLAINAIAGQLHMQYVSVALNRKEYKAKVA